MVGFFFSSEVRIPGYSVVLIKVELNLFIKERLIFFLENELYDPLILPAKSRCV